MENMIKSIKISKLFGDKDIKWNLQKTNVLVGKNGMGKSTILQLIIATLSKKDTFKKSSLCESITILTEQEDIFSMRNEAITDEIRKALLKALQDNPKILEQIKNESDNKFNSEQFYENLNNPYNKSELTAFISSSNDNDDKLNFEFISTVNLNANSTQNLSLANGEIQNILDLEIQTELQRLLVINNEVLNKQLITALNIMFSESKKDVSLNDKFELEFKVNNEILNFPQLSSGERQVIYILLKVAIATKDNALILMDEPEISLHLSWQEKLLTQIREINPNSQIIIVTHSPAIVMNGWLDCFVDIQDIIVKG